MFTGIVQALGTIEKIKKMPDGMAYTVLCSDLDLFGTSKIGDSICINGVCQTIESIHQNTAVFHALKATLENTTLKNIQLKQKMNLETALKFGDKVGGHLMSGHIGCQGKIKSIIQKGKSYVLSIQIDAQNAKYLLEEGSIAIDGISLTISKMPSSCIFEVSVIPHTFNSTILQYKKMNDLVNIEIDLVTKNIHLAVNQKRGSYALFS
jgi:riboflavin synthase